MRSGGVEVAEVVSLHEHGERDALDRVEIHRAPSGDRILARFEVRLGTESEATGSTVERSEVTPLVGLVEGCSS